MSAPIGPALLPFGVTLLASPPGGGNVWGSALLEGLCWRARLRHGSVTSMTDMALSLSSRVSRQIYRVGDAQLRKLGWHLARYPAPQDRLRQLLLNHLHVDLIIDVGANVGQYGNNLRECGYTRGVVSLEPMSAAYGKLVQAASRDGDWTTLQTAAGTESGAVVINIAANSVSSSLLPMLDRHRLSSRKPSDTVAHETVKVQRLDQLAPPYLAHARRPFLKIDTQGFEKSVLDGASGCLQQFVAVEMEMSLVPLYGGQMLYREALDYMAAAGFRLSGIHPGFWDKETGETLQADGTFLRVGTYSPPP